jgi:hypothetical protein
VHNKCFTLPDLATILNGRLYYFTLVLLLQKKMPSCHLV